MAGGPAKLRSPREKVGPTPKTLLIRRYDPLATHLHVRFVMLEAITGNLERYMDLLSARQKLVASNIANADTPGYKTQDIDFQSEFLTLAQGEQPLATDTQGLAAKPDGNNVSLDREARLLAEDAMRFNVASTLLRSSFKTVLEAIQGGGGA